MLTAGPRRGLLTTWGFPKSNPFCGTLDGAPVLINCPMGATNRDYLCNGDFTTRNLAPTSLHDDFRVADQPLSRPSLTAVVFHLPNCCPILDGARAPRRTGNPATNHKDRLSRTLETEMLQFSRVGTNALAEEDCFPSTFPCMNGGPRELRRVRNQ